METWDDKQPAEKEYFWFDFTLAFSDDDGVAYDTIGAVVSITVVDTDDDSDVADTIYDDTKNRIEGLNLGLWLHAGTDGKTYKVTAIVSGDVFGEEKEMEALLRVVEK